MITLALLMAAAASAPHVERRCGWLDNPTPANWWLTDRQAEWTLGVQGGYQAEGADMPDPGKQWVVTNGVSYGYGCACIEGVFDRRTKHVVTVKAAQAKPLAVCRADKGLERR